MNLLYKSRLAVKKINQWAKNEREYVRRTAFSLIAVLAAKDKEMKDKDFVRFFPLIKKYSIDDRNFVKKAVNWAIRQIGKRNKHLNKEAVKLSKEIKRMDTKSARWIANNALLELTDKKTLKRIK
jgi:3-methyladenine DNA glycosylase AlkD